MLFVFSIIFQVLIQTSPFSGSYACSYYLVMNVVILVVSVACYAMPNYGNTVSIGY